MTGATPTSETINAKPLAAFANSKGRKRKGRARDFGARKKGGNARAETSALALFGPPQLLQGEDGGTYSELLSRFRVGINPVDIIDEMFIVDVVALEWEVLRWRRFKAGLMRTRGLETLEYFLNGHLHYDEYRELFEKSLANWLCEDPECPTDGKLTEDAARNLAHRFVQNEPDAVDAVHRILDEEAIADAYGSGRFNKAKELAHDYMRRKPGAVEVVDKVLAREGSSIDALMVRGMANIMDDIDRIDHLATIAETRRNATLREIDRRRATLGQGLRRQVREVEGEYEVIGTTPAVTTSAA